MKLVLLLSLGMLVSGMGCGRDSVPNKWVNLPGSVRSDVVVTKALSPEEQIAAWRAKANEKKLYWKIVCTRDDDPKNQFFGQAWEHPGDLNGWYWEDGRRPTWADIGATQSEVAAELLADVDLPPNMIPNHAPSQMKEEMAHKQCPPPLTGKP